MDIYLEYGDERHQSKQGLGLIDPPKSPRVSLISPNKKEVEMRPKFKGTKRH
jgi:hypothetical protein